MSPRSTRGSGSTCAGSPRSGSRERSPSCAATRRGRSSSSPSRILRAARACARRCQRRRFDELELELVDGERVLVEGKAEIYEAKGELSFRAQHDRADRARRPPRRDRAPQARARGGGPVRGRAQAPAAALPARRRRRHRARTPQRVATSSTGIRSRFPAAHIVVAETRVQGAAAGRRIAAALRRVAAHPAVDVVIVARGGGSFEDLLPFSDEAVVRAFAACPVPVVSAVGHEQDTPLCDLAADVRASTPTAAARLVVPDLAELQAGSTRLREPARRLRPARARTRPRAPRARRRPASRRAAAPPRAAARRPRPCRRPAPGALAAGHARARVRRRPLGRRGPERVGRRSLPGSALEIELATGGLAATVTEVRP